MALDMYLRISPKIELDLIREVVTHNRKAYRYTHAKRALAHDFNAYGKFVASFEDFFYEEREEFDPLLHVSTINVQAYLKGRELKQGERVFVDQASSERHDLRVVYEEIQSELQSFLDAAEHVPPILSEVAQQFLLQHPEYEEYCYVELPSFSTPQEKKASERFDTHWRKASHIHLWFVDHLQNGKDDHQPYVVYRDQLTRLQLTLIDVMELYDQHADQRGVVPEDIEKTLHRLLPASRGATYSRSSYEKRYHDQNKKTYAAISYALDNTDFDKYMLVYNSSL